MSTKEEEFLAEIDRKFQLREEQFKRQRNMLLTLAVVLLGTALTLGAANISAIANHGERINRLEQGYQSFVPWELYADYTEFMNLKFRAFEALYEGTFPEKYPEFSVQLENLERSMLRRYQPTARGADNKDKQP